MEYYTAPLKVKVMLKGISKFDRLVSKKFFPLFFFTFQIPIYLTYVHLNSIYIH